MKNGSQSMRDKDGRFSKGHTNNLGSKRKDTSNMKKAQQKRYEGKRVGYITEQGYIRMTINRKRIFLHRLIWEQNYGEIPEGYVVHHIDGDKLNNNIENLMFLQHSKHSSIHVKKKDPDNIIKCDQCLKDCYCPKSRRKKGKRHFCDKDCYERFYKRGNIKMTKKTKRFFSIGWFLFWTILTGIGGFIYLAIAYVKKK